MQRMENLKVDDEENRDRFIFEENRDRFIFKLLLCLKANSSHYQQPRWFG
jgi:hypothetical protein